MRRPGFTTIEMMLALYLLAIGISTTAYMISASHRGLSQGKLVTQAAFFAQQRLEEALLTPSAGDVKVHPDVPELTGEIRRSSYGTSLLYVEAVVYKTNDQAKRPLVRLESLGGHP